MRLTIAYIQYPLLGTPATFFKMKKLTRSKNKVIAGVCSGFAEYLDVDPTLVRVIFSIFTVFSMGAGILIYLTAWMLMPKK